MMMKSTLFSIFLFVVAPLVLGFDQHLDHIRSIPAGNLPTKKQHYTLPGFNCGDDIFANGTVFIYFPSDLKGLYPIVSFLHGSGGGKFDDLCHSTASLGIVVVAVAGGVCGDWTQQQLHAIRGSQANEDLHPALSHVNYKSVGVMGHSQGGAFTMGSATHAHEYNIKAMVASHGGSPNAAPQIPKDVPCMFSTGSSDPKRRKLYWAFDPTPGRPSIFANLVGGSHMEPIHSGKMNEFCAHFLGCYTIPRPESCQLIYGNSTDALCYKYPMADCQIRWN